MHWIYMLCVTQHKNDVVIYFRFSSDLNLPANSFSLFFLIFPDSFAFNCFITLPYFWKIKMQPPLPPPLQDPPMYVYIKKVNFKSYTVIESRSKVEYLRIKVFIPLLWPFLYLSDFFLDRQHYNYQYSSLM